jgi:hypothetical protein
VPLGTFDRELSKLDGAQRLGFYRENAPFDQEGASKMKFSELVDQASEFLRRRERVSYRALKREFDLDDESLEDLKAELMVVFPNC